MCKPALKQNRQEIRYNNTMSETGSGGAEVPIIPAELTPTLEGNGKGDPLYKYFETRLPNDLSKERYENGLTCLGFAKLIIGELGGPSKARIMWLTEGEEDDPTIAHAFVVRDGAAPEEPAYQNNFTGEKYRTSYVTNGYLREHGEDITEEILAESWDHL